MSAFGGDVVAHHQLGANDAVRLRIAATLESAGSIVPANIRVHLGGDRVDEFGFSGKQGFLTEHLIDLAPLKQREALNQRRQRLAQELVERGPEEWIDAALGM